MNEIEKEQTVSANERMILDIVRRSKGLARSAIAGQTNLTQQSVHRIIDHLVKLEFLQLGEPIIQGRGQPSPHVSLNPEAFFSIGVSLNTDDMSVSLVNFCGETLLEENIPFAPVKRLETQAWLKTLLERWCQQNPSIESRIVGVGFAMTGYFIKEKGHIRPPDPLFDWSGVDLQTELEALLGWPVILINNATTGAIGEAFHGAGLTYQTFGYLSFNFGFGGGIVIDGEPFFGAYGNAGEIGRIFTTEEAPQRPALSMLIKALARQGIDVPSVAKLKTLFDPTWPGVAEWVEQTTPYFLRAINALRGVIDPDAIVLGGEIPKSLAHMLLDSLERRGMTSSQDISVWPQMIVSELKGDSATLGAALQPLRQTFFRK
ncbi:ROK family transcriptional regulator [Marinomonas spartinae]|uniref:ROK family transcriptional regulator n=1 Tax=Marinomonas spartinae TaxID=1792290 RepID=UPI0018F22B65|nr:ROK family transcriptional regulator [Marinomonas spartinae]MBJ7554582.1 ROK family transcriptional regulator [Marinomonas spartinae]